MSKAKWFAVRKPSTGEIIDKSANQIVPPKFRGGTKMLYYIHLGGLKGGLGTILEYHISGVIPTYFMSSLGRRCMNKRKSDSQSSCQCSDH